MRALLALGLLIAPSASTDATAHHSHKHHHVIPGSVTITAPSDLYCLQKGVWGLPGNCQFSTYEQCKATASGTAAVCGRNPHYLFAE